MIAPHERRVRWLIVGAAVLMILAILGGILAVATLATPAFGFGSGPFPGVFLGWGMMFLMMLVMLVFWVLILGGIIALVVWAIRGFGPRLGRREDEALAILDQRFARGEINQEECEMRQHELLAARR